MSTEPVAPLTMDSTEQVCKFLLCVLLTQLGKTFTAINRILAELKQDSEFGRSIHIVFTMNTLLNNKQFAKRLQMIEDEYGKGSICVLASKYDGPYVHVKNKIELQGLFLDEETCPRVVLLCSNKRRYDDGVEFLKVINKNSSISHVTRAFAYFDELHEYINDTLRAQLEEIHSLDIVKAIVALTATPYNIWKATGFWSNIRLLYLEAFNDTNYAGFADMIFNLDDSYHTADITRSTGLSTLNDNTIGYIKHVLDKHSSEILTENARVFIPAHRIRKGHDSVRELIYTYNRHAVVVVLNGVEKTLQYKDSCDNTKTISLVSKDEEVCETIARIILREKLGHRPLIITGFLCVGMGQTLTHRTLGSFTAAIFGHLDLSNDEIYQLFGRITGRMKLWGAKYVRTQVYCPTVIMNRCCVMEECARNMVCEYNGEIVTQENYKEPMITMGEIGKDALDNIRVKSEKKKILEKAVDSDKEYRVFSTQEEAIAFAATTLHSTFKRRPTNEAPEEVKVAGKNPSVEKLIGRMWGINAKSKVRMIPTDTEEWCVYWRPSFFVSTPGATGGGSAAASSPTM